MTGTRHAEIAGAGFAGMVAGTALAQRGWSVRVHEAAPELRAFGAGIFIWENGLRVLAAIGAYDAVVRGSHEAVTYETRRENRLVAEHVFARERGTRMLTMTRQHLYSSILAAARAAGVEFRTRSEVVGATAEGVLLTADGASYPADLVIGADGVKSRVRDFLGLLAQRSACADGIARVLGPRCKSALAAGTDWDHVIDFWNLGRRTLRILYVPCNEQDLYLAMMAPVDDAEASAIPIRQDIWVPAFPQLEPVLRHITAGGRYDAYETTRLSRWSAGRVAIVGDAAHAMVPTLGQGAGAAMMNALALAFALEDHDVEAALALWEERERPLTDYTQDLSEQSARQRAMSGAEVWDDRTLRTANHVPTGTHHLPRPLA